MVLQNRVHADGSIHAVPDRGTLMGNRGGRIHTDRQTLSKRRWASKAWICCETAFRERHRAVMGAGYTVLFFLDEATALAAGHRPCFECRRTDARAFAAAFSAGGPSPRAGGLDAALHAERLGPRPTVSVADLPTGAMIADNTGALLVIGHGLMRWSFAGYTPTAVRPQRATLLTPLGSVGALRAGYRPRLHWSIKT